MAQEQLKEIQKKTTEYTDFVTGFDLNKLTQSERYFLFYFFHQIVRTYQDLIDNLTAIMEDQRNQVITK